MIYKINYQIQKSNLIDGKIIYKKTMKLIINHVKIKKKISKIKIIKMKTYKSRMYELNLKINSFYYL